MSRRHISFECDGDCLAATMDDAPGGTGLLIVSGGNEIRSGAFAGQAKLAARIADAGYPVFRFDRRGVGDSEGVNRGYRESLEDIATALAAFRTQDPLIKRVIGYGNCDAATALMLMGGAGFDRLILANPWTLDDGSDALRPEEVRARYAGKLAAPREWLRLLSGKVSFTKLGAGLKQALKPAQGPSALVAEMQEGLGQFAGSVKFLLAGRDRTAQAFVSAWDSADPRIELCPMASHGFAEPEAMDWLFQRLLEALQNGHKTSDR